MAFQGAQGTDARYATFNEVHGDQVNITNMVSYSGMKIKSSDGCATAHIRFSLLDGHPQYAAAARFDSTDRQPCLEGTREKILESVYDWIHTKGQ
jgi:hypothetical protein